MEGVAFIPLYLFALVINTLLVLKLYHVISLSRMITELLMSLLHFRITIVLGIKVSILKHPVIMKTNKENVDPKKVKVWISVIIAILSAIAGALGESATDFVSNLNLF